MGREAIRAMCQDYFINEFYDNFQMFSSQIWVYISMTTGVESFAPFPKETKKETNKDSVCII